jgi:hypothetical protein
VYWEAEPAKFKEVFQEFGALFLPEVAQPRCLRPTQYPLETGDRLNTNPAITSPTQGIHQAPLKNFGVYSSFASTTDSNYAITSPVSSIPQALRLRALVYAPLRGIFLTYTPPALYQTTVYTKLL